MRQFLLLICFCSAPSLLLAQSQEFVFPEPRPGSVERQAPALPDARPSSIPRSRGTFAPTSSRSRPTLPITFKECQEILESLNVIFVPIRDVRGPGQCGLTDAVEVSAFNDVRLLPPAPMTCLAAAATAQWLRNAVVPQARARFGSPVVDIRQISTYSCRSQPNGQLSEHAYGNALDISALVLSDGTTISVSSDWRRGGQRGRFLRAIARASCAYFSTVLTPLSDGDYQDHFHLDKGPWISCGA